MDTTREPTTLIAEDVLLLLFKPDSGTIAGENTLFYVLGGAVLAELSLSGAVDVEQRGLRGAVVSAAGDAPDDEHLRAAWDYAAKPRGAQSLIAAVGPGLREPLLDRLVAGGHIRRGRGRALGLIPVTTLEDGGTGHRAAVLARVRAALVDGATPDPRTAAIAALLSASGALPTFDPEIPWTSPVITRAKQFEQGDWGAEAAARAVARTTAALIASSVAVAAALPSN